jgi:O-antigen/teichoic acid export membrane protein
LFPALSSIQDDQERFLRGYLIVSEIVAILSVVLCSLSIINAEVLVIGLFGAKWAPVVPIFMWLMIKSIVVPNNGVIITTILAKGYAKENFNYVVIKQIIGMLPIIYLLFGDLDSFLHSLVAAGIIILAVSYFSAYKLLQISFWEQLKPLLILVGISVLILFLLQYYLTLENSVLNALVKSAIYVLCMGGFLWLNHKNIIKEAAGLVRSK